MNLQALKQKLLDVHVDRENVRNFISIKTITQILNKYWVTSYSMRRSRERDVHMWSRHLFLCKSTSVTCWILLPEMSLLKYKMYELHPHWYLGHWVIQKYCHGSFDMNSSTNIFLIWPLPGLKSLRTPHSLFLKWSNTNRNQEGDWYCKATELLRNQRSAHLRQRHLSNVYNTVQE